VPEQVAFPALIKELNVKSLVTGDKEARLVLQFQPTDDLLDQINRLHRADELIMAAIVPIENNNHQRIAYNASTQRKKRQPQRPPEGNAQ